jgi:glucokinase
MSVTEHLLGFDIGGTKCAVVLGRPIDAGGIDILGRREFRTATELGAEQAIVRLEQSARDLLAHHRIAAACVRGIGISCGGPLIGGEHGVIVNPPNLPGWENTPICNRVSHALGMRCVLRNDADACALAEWQWGAGKGTRNMVFLTFGTGMGAGLILDGRLYSGASDLAGEVGHVRLSDSGPIGYGKSGSFEGFCSGGGIARCAREHLERLRAEGERPAFAPEDGAEITARMVIDAARAGDKTACAIMDTAARYLGRGLAILIDILNPEAIVIGSIFTRAQDLLWPGAQAELRREALSGSVSACRVLPAALGEQIGDFACLSLASTLP